MFTRHKADILCLTINEEGTILYSSGVDRAIVQYKHTPQKWIQSGEKRYHSHDVNALCLLDNQLYSGGIDQKLCLATAKSFPESKIRNASYFGNNLITTTNGSKLLLAQFQQKLSVWELGVKSCQTLSNIHHTTLNGQSYKHLVDINVKTGTLIQSSSISHTGRLVALSSLEETKLFDIKKEAKVNKIATSKPSEFLLFTQNEQFLIGIREGVCSLMETLELRVEHEFEFDGICLGMKVSPDNNWLCISTLYTIYVYNLDTFKVSSFLPKSHLI